MMKHANPEVDDNNDLATNPVVMRIMMWLLILRKRIIMMKLLIPRKMIITM